jgi:hypothetical protein
MPACPAAAIEESLSIFFVANVCIRNTLLFCLTHPIISHTVVPILLSRPIIIDIFRQA